MTGAPHWFEIGVADVTKARSFYGELFGWEFEGGPSGDGEAGFVIRTAGIDGGLHGGDEGARPYLFFEVEDMDAALEQVRALGGRIEPSPGVDPDSATGVGRFALCTDDQGSSFGLHQPASGA